ncbi:hypothetical protein ABZ307_43085 [Streptomyces griseorubiginosus]|uniref:hypothetical protein n=1 Tax=Streptomyces griseorubiginosus TaxID=67304 RepID=UPI0033A58571
MSADNNPKPRRAFVAQATTSRTHKIVFSSQCNSTADTVSKRYPGSVVREYDPAKK